MFTRQHPTKNITFDNTISELSYSLIFEIIENCQTTTCEKQSIPVYCSQTQVCQSLALSLKPSTHNLEATVIPRQLFIILRLPHTNPRYLSPRTPPLRNPKLINQLPTMLILLHPLHLHENHILNNISMNLSQQSSPRNRFRLSRSHLATNLTCTRQDIT